MLAVPGLLLVSLVDCVLKQNTRAEAQKIGLSVLSEDERRDVTNSLASQPKPMRQRFRKRSLRQEAFALHEPKTLLEMMQSWWDPLRRCA